MRIKRRGIGLACRLALQDLWHDRLVSACSVVGLTAVLCPLLILFGLRFGVVEGLLHGLESDPRSREMRPLVHGGYDSGWLANLGARPEVGFIVGNTRFLSSQVEIRGPAEGAILVDLVPTKAGDPVVADGAAIADDPELFAVSASVAQRLHLQLGSMVPMAVSRRRAVGGLEEAVVTLHLAEILRPAATDRDTAFVSLKLLQQIEDYREGEGSLETPTGVSLDGRQFATFRIYAKTIYDVAPLREVLLQRGIDTASMLSTIELVTRLDRGVTSLFALIAVLGCTGYLVVLTMSVWASTEHRRGQIAVLRLIGFEAAAVAVFPLLQGVTTGIAGGLVSVLLFLLARPLVNAEFPEQLAAGRAPCDLNVQHYAIALAASVALSALATSVAVVRVTRVAPAESLRLV